MTGLLALTVAGTVAAAWAGTGFIVPWLGRRGLVDRPNERSSHGVPTPRGGGIAPVAVTLAAWFALALGTGLGRHVALLAAGAILLLVVGWVDDRRGLSRALRLAAQAAAVTIGLAALPPAPVLQGVAPPEFDRVVAGLIWLWFLNLYNFMDGIDGLAAGETTALGLGSALAVLVLGQPSSVVPHAVALSGAAAGFLRWNWPPARVFLGDSGSVALAYLAGWLLLTLAASGAWAAALILPLYHLADPTMTLAL
ncbi:MAG: glycosyl transferase, partial [Alphaproteobacteria bacterium]